MPRACSMRATSEMPPSPGAATTNALETAAWSAPIAVKVARNDGPKRPRNVTW